MEYDVQLATELSLGIGSPTLRVYRWKPYAVSIGMNQNIEDFDAETLATAGIDIVRRPTGGRAILHADELTYSVVMPSQGRSLRDIYRFINEGLLCGLRLLGVRAELANVSEDFRSLYQEPTSVTCFSSSAKCEIHYQGKKLVGSAQRRYGTTILQHGSVLLGPAHRDIIHFLSENVKSSHALVERELANKTCDLQTILGRSVSFEEVSNNIKQGFKQACNIDFIDTGIQMLQFSQ